MCGDTEAQRGKAYEARLTSQAEWGLPRTWGPGFLLHLPPRLSLDRQCQVRTARNLNKGGLAEDVTTAGDENFREGELESVRTCLLCEVDTNCTSRESLTDHRDLGDELTEKTQKLLMT